MTFPALIIPAANELNMGLALADAAGRGFADKRPQSQSIMACILAALAITLLLFSLGEQRVGAQPGATHAYATTHGQAPQGPATGEIQMKKEN